MGCIFRAAVSSGVDSQSGSRGSTTHGHPATVRPRPWTTAQLHWHVVTLSKDYLNPFYFQSHTVAFHSQLQHVIPLPCINLCNAHCNVLRHVTARYKSFYYYYQRCMPKLTDIAKLKTVLMTIRMICHAVCWHFHSRLRWWVATAGGHFEHFVQYTKWAADVNHLNFWSIS